MSVLARAKVDERPLNIDELAPISAIICAPSDEVSRTLGRKGRRDPRL